MGDKVLDIAEKQDVQYCIPLWLRDEQIRANVKRIPGRILEGEGQSEPIAIVGYGPSLNDTWEEIKKFKYIISCSGSHKFLIDHGIIPTWHVEVDPRKHKVELIGQPHKDVQYLLASCCHPKVLDHLEGYNVKLWHVFSKDGESEQVIPKGEWSITGGCDVGMRCMTIARFLGFTDFHIFGLDGCDGKSGVHAASHPNQPKKRTPVECNGKTFNSTPALVECSRQVFKELDQLPDVKSKFYGEGLIQEMAKTYEKKPVSRNLMIAAQKPELISKEYAELNARLHKDNLSYGVGGGKHVATIIKLAESINTKSILDYGAGKQYLAKSLPFPIWSYDPAIPAISESPRPADLVCCTDVLEHIEPDKINYVLDDLKRCVLQIGYFVINIQPSSKTLADGRNAHLLQKDKDWWNKKLSKFFEIGTIIDRGAELHIVVSPKKKKVEKEGDLFAEIDHEGRKINFHVPNDTIQWRCETLLTKEPITIEWIESFKKGETMIDVGANMGGYSLLAAAKGVKVFSFEPEASNYNLLQKNIILNKFDVTAYCAAITDKPGIDKLHLSQVGIGGSCHSYGEGEDRITQGCIGLKLDDLGIKADHIKIDVDGQEHKVIAGAENLLKNGVKSVLIEVNTNLPVHQEMIKKFESMGFTYSQTQVDKSIRKEGAFKGCAEYVFKKVKATPLEKHIVKAIEKGELKEKPFKYLYVENIFTDNIYKNIIKNMPDNYVEIEKSRGTKGYPKRFTSTPTSEFWKDIYTQLLSGSLKKSICEKFGITDFSAYTEDLLLIRDNPGYKIAPHTDSTKKVISVLFYLPEDNSMEAEGTSIFIPKDKKFVCKTGDHYKFEDFKKVYTAPFKPNSVLMFMRTDNSFHGVEPCEHVRNVLLYNIRTK